MYVDLYKLDARDPPKAVGFLTKACDQCNNINACYNLAVLLKNGKFARLLHYIASLGYHSMYHLPFTTVLRLLVSVPQAMWVYPRTMRSHRSGSTEHWSCRSSSLLTWPQGS